ncbi:eCIS core domain-containing protein [Corallococcus interemptor]|uniref:eCIS core domain-containing protein n=1 Tax=Corallococcus interemptor TaxID=2316720 RepID=UPI0018F71911
MIATPGKGLTQADRAFFEPRFGFNFERVRIHDDSRADASARAVAAKAYTVGEHIVFRRGAYLPESTTGVRLLAHELAHVVQQSQGGVVRPQASQSGLAIVSADDPSEREADQHADTVLGSKAVREVHQLPRAPNAGSVALQRRVVCDEHDGCWEEEENMSRAAPDLMSLGPNMSRASPGTPLPSPTSGVAESLPGAPLAASMLSPTSIGPPPRPPPFRILPEVPGTPIRPPTLVRPPPLVPVEPLPPVRPSVPVGPGGGVGLGARIISGAGSVARVAGPIGAFLGVLLWPSSTAAPWQDTLNPVTRAPWRSQEEYEQFWRLPPEERQRLIRAGQATSSSTSVQVAPQAAPRRNPNQTCEDAVLDQLQAEKDRICNSIPGESCSPSKVSPKRLARRPCSEIRRRIQAVEECLRIRQRIQDECFGGQPDQAHQDVMNQLQAGLQACRALAAVNCAPGHPMANL